MVDPNGMGFVGYLIAEQVDPTRRIYFYNKLSGDSDRIVAGYEAFADEFSTILSRQLDS